MDGYSDRFKSEAAGRLKVGTDMLQSLQDRTTGTVVALEHLLAINDMGQLKSSVRDCIKQAQEEGATFRSLALAITALSTSTVYDAASGVATLLETESGLKALADSQAARKSMSEATGAFQAAAGIGKDEYDRVAREYVKRLDSRVATEDGGQESGNPPEAQRPE